jgi:ABC-type multidrug transport system permease subunit
MASFIAEIPVKLLSTTIFDLVLYFMTGLSRTRKSFPAVADYSSTILYILLGAAIPYQTDCSLLLPSCYLCLRFSVQLQH